MYQKAYQKKFTESIFQQCELFLDAQDSHIITTINHQMELGQVSCEIQKRYKYTSFLVRQNSVIKLQDLRIFDVAEHQIKSVELNNQHFNFSKCLLCNNFGESRQEFATKYKDHFASSIVNLVNDSLFLAKFVTSQVILKINQQKDRLFLQDFQWNALNFDIFDTLPKVKTNYLIKKKDRTVLDLHQIYYKNEQIQNAQILNEYQVLLHLGRHSQISQKNFLICKYDLSDQTTVWKQQLSKFQTFFNKSIQISHNSILNGVYNFQNRQQCLKLYDFRTKGQVLCAFQQNAQLVRLGSNPMQDFHYIQRISDFQILSIVSAKGGAINHPILFDIRNFQTIQLLKPRREGQNMTHLKQMRYKKPYLFTVQRQYQHYSFRNAKICKYELHT